MRDIIKQVLKEETSSPEQRAKKYLSSLNLEPWQDKKYGMQYLVVPKSGRIIFLLIQNDYECTVLNHFYDMLKIFFKGDENQMTIFVYDYLKTNGLSLNFHEEDFWLTRSEDTGYASIEDGDTPIESRNLNEGKMLPKNKFAKSWISKFNDLKKYKSEDGRFIYLASNSGTILVSLDTQMNETAVSWEIIWSMLEKHFTEKETRRKIIDWLLDQYHLTNMGYVYSETQDVMGKIDNSDILIDPKKINESEEKSKLERFFIKRWDDQKKQGIAPNIMDLKLMGLESVKDQVLQYFIKYMGLSDENSRTNAVKNYLLTNIFTEKQIRLMSHYFENTSRITVKFTSIGFSESRHNPTMLDMDCEFEVLDGSFYSEESDEMVAFSSNNLPFDDMVEHFEFQDIIRDVIGGLVGDTLESFGFNINKHFDEISVEWE
jgi:hypothetical protein